MLYQYPIAKASQGFDKPASTFGNLGSGDEFSKDDFDNPSTLYNLTASLFEKNEMVVFIKKPLGGK